MKRPSTFFLFILFLTVTKGQSYYPYPQPGLVQGEICYGNWTSPGVSDASITYLGDTVISSLTYSKFSSQYFSSYYTRYDNGKIYLANTNFDGSISNEVLQYDFTLSLNDTFHSNAYWVWDIVVDSVSTVVLLNGQTRKYMRLNGYGNEKHYWVDGIGSIKRGFLYYADFEGGWESFICARDNSGLLWVNDQPDIDCDSLTNYNVTGIYELKKEYTVYPNPAANILTIETSGIMGVYQLYDVTGKELLSGNITAAKFTLDISLFSKGVYFLRLFNGEEHLHKKIIKE